MSVDRKVNLTSGMRAKMLIHFLFIVAVIYILTVIYAVGSNFF